MVDKAAPIVYIPVPFARLTTGWARVIN